MSILNFPSDPASVFNVYVGDNGITYQWDGTKWVGQSSLGVNTSNVLTSHSAEFKVTLEDDGMLWMPPGDSTTAGSILFRKATGDDFNIGGMGWVDYYDTYEGVGIYSNNTSVLIGTADLNNDPFSRVWDFDNMGTLTVPNDGTIQTLSGNLTIGTSVAGVEVTANYTTAWYNIYGDLKGNIEVTGNIQVGTSIAHDSGGNIYVLGSHFDYNIIDWPGDTIAIKYDPYGNLLWRKSWTNESGDWCGSTNDVFKIDTANNDRIYWVSSENSPGVANAYVGSMDSDGIITDNPLRLQGVWPADFVITPDANVIVAGQGYDESGAENGAAIAKIDLTTGDVIWSSNISVVDGTVQTDAYISATALDPNTGYTWVAINYRNLDGNYRPGLSYYASEGFYNTIFDQASGTTPTSDIKSIDVAINDGYLYTLVQNFDDDSTIVSKYAIDQYAPGALQWQQVIDVGHGTFGDSLAFDSNNNVYVSGNTYANPGIDTDFFIAKLDLFDGTPMWARLFGSLLRDTSEAGLNQGYGPTSSIYADSIAITGMTLFDPIQPEVTPTFPFVFTAQLPIDGSLNQTVGTDYAGFHYYEFNPVFSQPGTYDLNSVSYTRDTPVINTSTGTLIATTILQSPEYTPFLFDMVGNAVVNTSSISPSSTTWIFGADGTLKLPAGGDIVDSNGDTVLGGPGGGTIWTNPANGCLRAELSDTGFQAYTTASHLDLQDGGIWNIGSYQNSTSIGNDQFSNQHDLSLRSGDATFITTNLRENGNHQWKFDTDGGLTLPDNSAINSGGIGVTNSAGIRTTIERDISNDIIHSQIDMGAGHGGIGVIADTDSSIVFAGVEHFGIGGFAGAVFIEPGITDGHVAQFDTDNNIILGYTQPGNVLTSEYYTAGIGVFNGDTGNMDGLLAVPGKVVLNSNNRAWTFGNDGNLTLPDFGAITSPNYGFSFNKNSGKTGAPELGTDVTFATESLDSDIVDGEVYMGSGYGEFRSIYNKVDSTESGLVYAGVEGFNYVQQGDVNFAGMVSQTPNIDSMYALSLNEQGQITIGFTQNGQTQTSNDWSVVVGTLNTDYTVNGLFANTNVTVIGSGLSSWTFDTDGTITLPNMAKIVAAPITSVDTGIAEVHYYQYDSSDTTISIAIGDEVRFPDFSGQILINDHSATGQLDMWLCGGASTYLLGSSKTGDPSYVNMGDLATDGGIGGYTWTSNIIGDINFTAIRTRNGA